MKDVEELKRLHALLPKKNKDFFNRLYKSLDEIPLENVRVALIQVKNTLDKNGISY